MSDYRWLTPQSQAFLEKGYLAEGQTVDERVSIIAQAAEDILGIAGYGEKLKSYFKKGWYSFSTPVWTNLGIDRGLPISCFGSHIPDSMAGILTSVSEVGMQTKYGGGTSSYFGAVRGRGAEIKGNGTSSGAVHFMQLMNTLMTVVSQGQVRRGNHAAYLPMEHPDIEEFLQIKSDGNPIQDISFGVTVTNQWLAEMKAGDSKKRKLWAEVLKKRANVGFPYIVFIDNMNDGRPDVYKDSGQLITHSNLCTEIGLPNSELESFVCDLSSMNILYYEEWKDTDAVETLVFLLDAVMTSFINLAKGIPYFEKAVRFAERHRAVGVGWVGWHSFLQSKMIAFESLEAKLLNTKIAKTIKDQAYAASAKLADLYGEPEMLKGYGRRNTTLLAIAPTKSSAFILGQVSEGIEPQKTNYYIKDLAKGKFSIKNPYLVELLQQKGEDTSATWNSILKNKGSVQHLSFLSENEKNVFKTFAEISPMEVVIQAAARQKYIDQAQSINLMIHPSIPAKDVNALVLKAAELGVKSLYYQISVNAAQSFTQDILSCSSCES